MPDFKYKYAWIVSPWQEAYVEMCADPTNHTTDVDFRKEYKIPGNTFVLWKRRFRNQLALEVDRRRKSYVAHIRSKIWKALDKRVDVGSDKAIELAFKLIGDFVERHESKVDYMRPEDKIERVKQLLSEVLAKKAQNADPEAVDTPVDDRPNVLPGPVEHIDKPGE